VASIFTKIINGEIPCYKIAEDDNFIAFLDVFPIVKGHVLVVPKQEVDQLFDMPEIEIKTILSFAQPIAKAIAKVCPCKRVGISAIGLEVPHAHLHLVPINSADDLNFTRPKLQVAAEEMLEIQKLIIAAIVN
jgi:histidine triad (HIT) family protein